MPIEIAATPLSVHVAVPVMVRDVVVATLHGDAQITGRHLGTAERDALAAYATGLGFAIERAVLADRLRVQRDAMREVIDRTERTIDDFLSAERVAPADSSAQPRPGGTARRAALATLSRREHEVLHLMATGATNQEIAAHLVLTVGTVKSHVKAVLRKSGASNRGHAIAMYLNETQSGQQ